MNSHEALKIKVFQEMKKSIEKMENYESRRGEEQTVDLRKGPGADNGDHRDSRSTIVVSLVRAIDGVMPVRNSR